MLPVYYEDNLVGQIEKAGPGLAFSYAPSWQQTSMAFAISVTMPLGTAAFTAEIATPWFANLLPEDRQLERIGRLLGRDQGDTYGLLEEMGRDTAGALSIGSPEPPAQAMYKELDEQALADAISRLPERPLLAGDPDITMSLAGAQTKLAVAVFESRISLPLRGAASTHILKPASDRLYASVENELLCLHLASSVGLRVASTSMGIAGDKRYLLVERFDRLGSGPRRVARGHQEDFCQAFGIYPTQKHEASGGPSLRNCFEVIDRHSIAPARDRLALLDLVIFACCIGDTDRHAKNYALLLHPEGPRLAPGYDLMTALAYGEMTQNFAMKIAEKKRPAYLERRHWERFAGSVQLAPAATVHRVSGFALQVAFQAETVAATLADRFPADRDALHLFAQRISEHARMIAANSGKGPSARIARPEDEEEHDEEERNGSAERNRPRSQDSSPLT